MPGTATFGIARAQQADLPVVSDALARAFVDDPVFGWVIRDPARRRELLPSLFALFTELYLPHREAYLAGDGAGAALWAPPGRDAFAGEQGEMFGERVGEIIGADAERSFELEQLLEQHHPSEECFYLQFVGVVPAHRGRGLGSRLLTTVLERCDADGTPAYLEATSMENRRLYERHGFVRTGTVTLPDGPCLWPMWRESTG